MSLIIPPGFAQALLKFALAGDPEEMVITHGVATGADVSGNMQGAITISEAFLTAFPANVISTSYVFKGTKLLVGQDGGPPAIYDEVRSVPGTAALANLPSNCAILVKKSTGLGGRRGRGRMFMPPMVLNEGAVDPNGLIDESNRAGINARWDTYLPLVDMVLFHDSLGAGIEPPPTNVGSLMVDSRIATQRRRMR